MTVVWNNETRNALFIQLLARPCDEKSSLSNLVSFAPLHKGQKKILKSWTARDTLRTAEYKSRPCVTRPSSKPEDYDGKVVRLIYFFARTLAPRALSIFVMI